MSEAKASHCARVLVETFSNMEISVRAEWGEVYAFPPERREIIEVYLKSISEPSIDEIPIISSIVESLSDRRVVIYEYESMARRGEPRHRTLARFIEKAIREGRPIIVLMPSALPASLYTALSQEAREFLANALALRITVDHPNILYLPLHVAEPIEIVAKSNSTSSYVRVRWLMDKARERGITVAREVYLDSNRAILEYVLWGGSQSLYRRIPVNKLALFIAILQRCGYIEGLEVLKRWERNTHVLYTVNVDYETVSRIYNSLNGRGSYTLHYDLTGILYSKIVKGAEEVMEEILSIL